MKESSTLQNHQVKINTPSLPNISLNHTIPHFDSPPIPLPQKYLASTNDFTHLLSYQKPLSPTRTTTKDSHDRKKIPC